MLAYRFFVNLPPISNQLVEHKNHVITDMDSMVMRSKFLLLFLMLISSSIYTMAQSHFYYYKGNKIPLTQNGNKVVVNIPKENEGIIERIHANAQILDSIKDETFHSVIISRSDFEMLTLCDFWEKDADSVILTSSFFTENKDEVFSTPYLTVRLKKENYKDLLTSYAESYKIRIVRNSPLMPLWYILSLTLESEKNSVDIANELYETGLFASSEPDLASMDLDYVPTSVRSITQPNVRNTVYDLQGRKVNSNSKIQNSKSKKGIYIQNGKKVVK